MLFKGRTIALNGFNRFALMLVALGIANSLLLGPAAAKTLAAWVELIGFDMEASVRTIVTAESACP